ncbi:VirK/YbjX family protein [Photobacterium damselae]|uniref:VirK/YbjX family protein n=1 Tax=Photobacterium damselae TaxID=38293 RepID=UPI00370B043F
MLFQLAAEASVHNPKHKLRETSKFVIRALVYKRQFKQMVSLFCSENRQHVFHRQPNFLMKCMIPYLHIGLSKNDIIQLLDYHHSWIEQTFTPGAIKNLYHNQVCLSDLMIGDEFYKINLRYDHKVRKEGELALSLEDSAGVSYYMLAFSVSQKGILVGCMQGGANDNGFSRKFTKAFYGLRPKSFMVETIQLLAQLLHIPHLYAVKNSGHIYNAKRYGKKAQTINLNYDQLWEEHDGEVYDEWFYQLPLESKRRAMEDIKRPKRKMYRERYEWLDGYKEQLAQSLEPLLNSSTVK